MHHSDWQPIETAPKNTGILVFMDGSVFEGELDGSYWDFPFANLHGCGCCSDSNDKPTHWMPLPEPPTKE